MAGSQDTKEMKAIERSWDNGTDLSAASSTDLTNYTIFKVNYYEEENVSDSNLWELFWDDFRDFTVSTFSKVKLRTQQVLHDFLRSRGVHISKNSKRKTISQTLFDFLQEEQHKWKDLELEDILQENYVLNSPKLARLIKTREAISTNVKQPTVELLETLNIKSRIAAPSGSSNDSSNIPLALLENNQQNRNSSPTRPANRSSTKFGKEIANMAKIYTEEQKYSGTNESLDYKLIIFYDICNRSDVPQEAYLKVLPTMLKGLALDMYYVNELSCISFQNAIAHLLNYFQVPEFQRKNLRKWNSITLKTIMVSNPEISTSNCLLLLIKELGKLQHGLRETLQTVEYLHDKLVTACQGVPACRYAISDPPPSLGAFINKLQSSIIAYEKENAQLAAFFTDRRYHKNFYNSRIDNVARRCYVCQKKDCQSWNHTDQER